MTSLHVSVSLCLQLSIREALLLSDRYDSKLSIKAREWKRRGCLSNSPEVIVNSKDQVFLRNMKAYFANQKNKDDLNSFVFNELESLAQQVLTDSQTLVLAGDFQITRGLSLFPVERKKICSGIF